MNSPIKYFGGKGTMFKEILSHFPSEDSYKIYIEPYGGSASILLSRPLNGHAEIYNDVYDNVYSLFKCLSSKELFIDFKFKCDASIYSSKLRKEFKEKLKDKTLSLLDRAFYFWYVNRTSHNGIGGLSANCHIRRKMAKATSDFLSAIDRLQELHDRLSSVIIESTDALELMDKYNKSDVFFYCDPPYHPSTRGATKYDCDYTEHDHEKFIDCVMKSDAKILISGYACEAYKKLESKFRRADFNVKTSGEERIETIWKNYA